MKATLGIIGCRLPLLPNSWRKQLKNEIKESTRKILNLLTQRKINYVLTTIDDEMGPWIATELTKHSVPYIAVLPHANTYANKINQKSRYWCKRAAKIIYIPRETILTPDMYSPVEATLAWRSAPYLSRNFYILRNSERILLFKHHFSRISKFTDEAAQELYSNGSIEKYWPTQSTDEKQFIAKITRYNYFRKNRSGLTILH